MDGTRVPKRTREELQLRSIKEILRASAEALPLNEILSVIANMTIIVFDASTSFFMLLEDGRLRTVLSRGEFAEEVTNKECAGETSKTCVAASSDRPIILQPKEIDAADPVLGVFAREKEPVVLLPLRAAGQHLGVLASTVTAEASLDISFLVTVAEQASNAVESAKLREETRTWRERLDAVFEGIGDPVLVFDPAGKLALTNAAAGELLRSQGVFLGDSMADVTEKTGVLDAEGKPLRVQESAAARALRGERVQNKEEHLPTAGGMARYFLVSAVPLVSEGLNGGIRGAVVVWRDITERKQVEQYREEYISLVSHDLRSPLTTIMGQAEWLRRLLEKNNLERGAQGAQAMLISAKRMNGMIQDLVESARLETGHMEMRKEPLDLVLMVTDLVKRIGSYEDNQRISVDIPEWVPPVLADPERIERAVTNLVTNALKFSEKPVLIQVSRQDTMATISVTDQGVGIPPEDLPHLFERHFRAKTAVTQEGLGLGLYIARLIAEAHGGKVRVESEVAKGSTFYLSLPLRDAEG